MTMCCMPRVSTPMRVTMSMGPGRRRMRVRREIIPLQMTVRQDMAAKFHGSLGTLIRRAPARCGTEEATLTESRRSPQWMERKRAAAIVKMLCIR